MGFQSSTVSSRSLLKVGLVAFAFLLSLNTAEALSIGQIFRDIFEWIRGAVDEIFEKLYDFGRSAPFLGRWFHYNSWRQRKAIKKAERTLELSKKSTDGNADKNFQDITVKYWQAVVEDLYNGENKSIQRGWTTGTKGIFANLMKHYNIVDDREKLKDEVYQGSRVADLVRGFGMAGIPGVGTSVFDYDWLFKELKKEHQNKASTV